MERARSSDIDTTEQARGSSGKAVCVLGMHRSGTSLAARLINLVGVNLGEPGSMVPATQDNERGFWENAAVVALNDSILARFGGSIYRPPSFPAGWESLPELEDLRLAARTILETQLQGTPCWGWKDPRTCLTFPFWQGLVPELDIVLCVRNPVDVACSLEKRDQLSLERGSALWLRYVSSALEHTASLRRHLVFYEDLLEDLEGELGRLTSFLGGTSLAPSALELAARFATRDLQHHASTMGEVLADRRVGFGARSLYLALRQQALAARQRALEAEALELFAAEALVHEQGVLEIDERVEDWYLDLLKAFEHRGASLPKVERGVPRFSGRREQTIAASRPDLRGITFGDRFNLSGGRILLDGEPRLELGWESLRLQRLEYYVAVHLLDESRQTILGQADRFQDPDRSMVRQGHRWVDLVALPREAFRAARWLGLGLYSVVEAQGAGPRAVLLPATGAVRSDSDGGRVLVPLHEPA